MTASAFRLARVQPLLGRPLLDDDERGGANVVVIGFDQWQEGSRRIPESLDAGCGSMTWTTPSLASCQRSLRSPSVSISGYLCEPIGWMTDVSSLPGWLRASRWRARKRRWGARAAAAESCGAGQRITPAACRSVRGGPVQHGREQALDRRHGPVARGAAAAAPVRKHRDIGLRACRRATGGVRDAVRAGCIPSRIVTQMFVEVLVLAAAAGTVGFLLPTSSPSPRPLGSRAAHHGTWQCSLLVRLPSLTERGALPGWTGCRRRRNRWCVPGLRVTGRWRRSGLHALGERGTRVGLGRTWTALLAMQVAVAVAVLPVGTQVIWGISKPLERARYGCRSVPDRLARDGRR